MDYVDADDFAPSNIFICNNDSKDHPCHLIPELCRQFYANGWVTGTGGGISVKYNDKIFIAPSGVQKDRIEPDDLFVQTLNGEDIIVPKAEKNLSKSQCSPIFMCAYNERNAGAVIHVHSQEVVKLCLLSPENELRITDLELIEGIFNEKTGKYYDIDEELLIPIIENSKYEKDLVDTFKMALRKYPSTSAVLVRNNGMYVWGSDWKSAKTQLECYEYLFKITTFRKVESYIEQKTPNKQPDRLEKIDNDNEQVGSNYEEQTLLNNDSKDHPRHLIPELCRSFYDSGWVSGTGGGISIKYNDHIFISPSGTQKGTFQPDDVFVQNLNGEDIIVPKAEKKLSKSQCTPIIKCLYDERNAGAVIHLHSQEVVKLCLLNPENELRITDLEMIKGIFNEKTGKFYENDEELIIPVIENSKYDKDSAEFFKMTLRKYPSTSAVLFRNHGMYVWGSDWKSAKTQCECYEYLFNITTFMKIHNNV